MHSISIKSLSFYQFFLVTFCTTPNRILLHLFTLGAGLNIRYQKGVHFSTLLVAIVLYRAVHQLGPHDAEELSLMGLLLIIIQNLTFRLVVETGPPDINYQ